MFRINGDILFPFFRNIIFRENRLNRTFINTQPAINAGIRINIQLRGGGKFRLILAAFIAAPRQLTRGLNLEGRVFLHDYQWRQDEDSSVLTLIMTAPLVVAHWINMQYYASTVCTGKWGAGSKTIHNVVGMHGVCSGNAGDLQVGLPIESLHDGVKWRHDGVKWRHDPLRLLAIIAAPCDKITRVVCQHSLVATLLDNQWIGLIAIDHDTEHKLYRYQPKGRWVRA